MVEDYDRGSEGMTYYVTIGIAHATRELTLRQEMDIEDLLKSALGVPEDDEDSMEIEYDKEEE